MKDLDESLSLSKDEYMDSISSFINDMTRDKYILCMRAGTKYFNEAEKLVSASKVDGKHNHGLLVADIAESCEAILESYLLHVAFLEKYNFLMAGAYSKPKNHACSNMQRMVKKYASSNVSDKLRLDFVNANLPTIGFDLKEPEDKILVEVYLPVGIGLLLMLISFASAIIINNPTSSQFFVIRGMFSLAGAGIGACIPGWLNLDIKGYIKAGGALGIFIALWAINPPSFVMN